MIERIIECYADEQFLKADGLDDAIIGVDEKSMRLIYSQKKCIEIFMGDGMTEEEALDHYYYNVEGAWVGDKTPIWCNDNI